MKQFLPFVLCLITIIFCNSPLYAQSHLVKGRVTNLAGKDPVEGATVLIKSSNSATSTDRAGEFSINAKNGDELVISYVGFETKRLKVTGSYHEISLSQNMAQLNEVVVTATGIKKEVRRLGYATQTVDASKLTQAREPDALNSLKGNVAGLSVNITPELGHAPSVSLRGDGSPMYVVDGVPMTSDTYNINPDDIESFTILKGPNAAALYGFAGQSGAIIINTKKGSKNKKGFSVDFNSSTQFNKGFIALPKVQDEYGPGEYGTYAFGDGKGGGVNDYDYDGGWGPKLDGRLLPQYDGVYDPNKTYTTKFENGLTYTGHIAPTPWVARGKDNLQRFIQTGLLSSNSIALSSSTDKTDTRFSVGNTYQKGIVPNTSLNNFDFTGNLTQRFSNKLTLNTYFNYNRQSTPNLPDVNYGPNSIIYNMTLWGGADWDIADMKDYWQPGKVGTQQKYAEYWRYNNPYFMSYEWLRGHYMNNEYGYVSLNYKLNDNIDFLIRPSVNAYDFLNTEKMPYSANSYRSAALGDYREDRRSLFQTNVEAQAQYKRNSILGFLDVQGLIGANVRSFKFSSNYTTTNYLNVPGIYSFSNSLNATQATSFNSAMKVLSAYYSFDIGYKSYVTLNTTGRVDKSSTLPTNNNTYYYPSLNLATVISEYVKLPKAISFVKARASYAESKSGGTYGTFSPDISNLAGSEYGYAYPSPYDGPSYQFSQTYNLTPTYNNQSSANYTNQTISNSIKTNSRKAYEVGLDIRFLKNAIGLDITRYHYRNTGIVSQGISSSTGYSSFLTNGNVYTNDGWEVAVNATPIKNPAGFSWNVAANWFTFKKMWVDNSNPNNYSHNGTRTDLVYGNAFVRTPDGQMVHDANSGLLLRYSDLGVNAQKVYGHADPDWQWGVVNTLSYKTLSLRFQFDGMVGGVMEDYVRKKTLQGGRQIETNQGAFADARPNDAKGAASYSYVGDGVVLTGGSIQLDPVTGEIVNMDKLKVTPNTAKASVQGYVSRMASIPDLDIISKTYAKLREVSLSYAIPQSVFGNKSFVRQVSLSVVARNLLYFFPSRYKDVDVDQYTQDSGSGLQTPTTRSYGVNLNISF
ncbi:MAG: outer membrane protein nutrient binding [Segetibacter sp.]|nr:outer membrane protein nutrient binding [Segetibacter sp.]